METTLAIVGWLMMAATLIPLLPSNLWWVRIFDFPRLQITIVFALTVLAYVALREDPSTADNVFLAALSSCLAYQLFRMRPYTPLHGREVHSVAEAGSAPTISFLAANVLMSNRDSNTLIRHLREHDPDVVLAVETDAWWEQELRYLEQTYAHCVKHPRSNTYGMLLYSKLPLKECDIKFLIQDDVPSIHARVQLRSGDDVVLRCLHPRPPAPNENKRTTERDAELLIVARELKGKDQPSIVIGDLNDVAWSRTNGLFQKISGLLDPRIGRGFFSTFNANWPLIRFPLDHVFVSRHFRLAAFEVLSHCGSDHFPIFVKLSLDKNPG